ncbi:MAG: methyltransferase domain-containing protein [Verrucomicrobia bacterium]|nr:methyltransferase domain-containing protein [Verrucomicrobiota bacterium]
MPAHKNSHCRYCGSTRLDKFLSLGEHPPSNSFLRPDQISLEKRYPLEVYLCADCYLAQLIDVVAAEEIFGDYLYLSSTSKALKNHYAALASDVTARFGLKAGDVVVDIGCNDGVLLSGYSLPGLVPVGVEPSKVADYAEAAGFKVMRGFFGPDMARQIAGAYGKAKVVTATNVYPHVDDIGKFTDGLPLVLADDGIFIIEASYLVDLIDQTLFDTIYHEHLCYLSLTPMVPFFGRHGLEIFAVEKVPFGASGPAIRVWAQKQGGPQKIQPSVAQMLVGEKLWGVGDLARYRRYSAQVEKIRAELLKLIDSLRASGARVGAYGAPAKGNTLLNYVGLTTDRIEGIAETNKIKQGLLAPGSHIPVVSEEEFLSRMPQYALLLTWNYLDFFLKNSDYIKRGGRFIVPIPEPRIVP